jgi:hypothetical protein
VLIILQIWERSIISPNYGVLSLVSLKEWGVSVIYPILFYFFDNVENLSKEEPFELTSRL